MKTIGMSIVVVLIALSVYAETEEVRLAQYIAGIGLLKHALQIDIQTKQAKYARLEIITGITTASAASMIDKYKSNPAEWSRLQQKIRDLLEPDAVSGIKE
jgi:hypothetical protein